MILLPYANGKTDIPIINSGNAISNKYSLLSSSSLSDDIFDIHEPIKNIIG
ncbi:hypothetical protein LOAG_15023, partial [Loa loa]